MQHNKERHAAAMLVHQIGSGIDALSDLNHAHAVENIESLSDSLMKLGNYLVLITAIKEAKNEQLRNHQ